MKFLFEDLIVYQKAMFFAQEILEITANAPKGIAALADQLRRAAMSIPANIAEGCGRWHTKDRKQFFWIARGSVHECVVFIELGVRQRIFSHPEGATFKAKLREIGRMLNALITSLGAE